MKIASIAAETARKKLRLRRRSSCSIMAFLLSTEGRCIPDATGGSADAPSSIDPEVTMSAQPFDYIHRHQIDERRHGWVYLLVPVLVVTILALALTTWL